MILEKDDTIYTINEKLQYLLRKDKENQFLQKSVQYSSNNLYNEKSTGDILNFKNQLLLDSNVVLKLFETPWIFYSYIWPTRKLEDGEYLVEHKISFNNKLANTMCSIMFWDGQEIIWDSEQGWTYNNYNKINNIFLPESIDTFRLEIIDTYSLTQIDGEEKPDKIINRELHLYDIDNINKHIIYNIEPDEIDENDNKIFYDNPILIYDKGR